jgi:hypothetical protein
LEARVSYDVDVFSCGLGYLGAARVFDFFMREIGIGVKKIVKMPSGRREGRKDFYTETGRILGEKDLQRGKRFWKELERELTEQERTEVRPWNGTTRSAKSWKKHTRGVLGPWNSDQMGYSMGQGWKATEPGRVPRSSSGCSRPLRLKEKVGRPRWPAPTGCIRSPWSLRLALHGSVAALQP